MAAQVRMERSDVIGPPQTLSLLLERVTGELRSLAMIVEEMQDGLGPILSDVSAREPEIYRHAQNIDLVWQTLTGLADVVALAARERPGNQAVDIEAIVAGLPLANVARRLRGLTEADAGDDLDLF